MKPKYELIRVVKAPDVLDENGEVVEKGQVSLDLTSKKSGRGAYICHNIECLQMARKARRLERAFSCMIPAEVYDAMEKELTQDE